jgi:uncharacterized protein YdhG (YjbR/CyaY superfamily)
VDERATPAGHGNPSCLVGSPNHGAFQHNQPGCHQSPLAKGDGRIGPAFYERNGIFMDGEKGQPTTVDEYIAQFPEEVQEILSKIRAVIKESAPEAVEKISYQMPGYFLNGGLVWFGAWKNHIGFYPNPSGTEQFKEELAAYKMTKGSVHFPLNKPVPYDLISRIVKFRVAENQMNEAEKSKRR